jgi:ABC-type transporter Mla maintaining outer membrane lipid asymmetry ATPase subunit MlaF
MVTFNRPAGGCQGGGAPTVSRMNVISCKRLTKRFGPTVAVSELDLEVSAGQVYGFLGPNGAGKTTRRTLRSPAGSWPAGRPGS